MFEHWKDFLHPHEGNDNHPHAYRTASAIALACVVAMVLMISAMQTGYIRSSSGFLSSVLPSVLVDMTNENRLDEGLGGLRQNDVLAEAANMKAEHMAENNYFAHDSPDGVTPWHWFQKAGYTYDHAGENLAIHFSDSEDVVEAWMESRLHRENILEEDFTEIGIGTAKGEYEGKQTVFVVQMFGTPDETELAERQQDDTQEQETQTVQTNQRQDEQEQASDESSDTQTTSTEQLVAELSDRVAEVQEDVQSQQSVDGEQAQQSTQTDQKDASTSTSIDKQAEQESTRQLAGSSNESENGQPTTSIPEDTSASSSDLLAQRRENVSQSTSSPQDEKAATPTPTSAGSIAGRSGLSLSPPGDTGWFSYLLSRPQLVLQATVYTLIGLILLALFVSAAAEFKHHHFWQASVSLLAIVLILGIYAFVQDLLFIETIVAGV